jgi:hypothetical protein
VTASSTATPAVPLPVPAAAPVSRTLDRVVALASLCYLGLAVAVTARLWSHPSASIVAGNPNDNDLYSWIFRYDATALVHLHLPGLLTNAMNPPQGISVMWNNYMLLPGVLLAPVTLLAGPQVSLTALLTLGFAGSATAMFAVLRRWDVSIFASALGGFVFGFAPALLQSAAGHYDLQFAVLAPLIADAFLRLVTGRYRRGPVRTGIRLGLLASAQIFIGEELLFDTMIAMIAAVVVLALSRPRAARARLREVAAGAGAGLLVTAVISGYALWMQFFGPLRGSGSPFTPDYFKNDLAGFVQPSAQEWLHTSRSAAFATAQGNLPEYLAYLGWPLLILLLVLAVAFWRSLVVRVTAVVFVLLSVLSLGGTLKADGHEHSWLKLPWYWVQTLPVSGSVLPDRFSIVAGVAAASLLAFGIDAWRRLPVTGLPRVRAGLARVRAAVPALALIAVLPLVPRPLPADTAAPLPPGWQATFTALRLPEGASVLVVPIPTATLTQPLRWQADTGVPASLYGGYFIGPANGHLYIDGYGIPGPASYLNQLWAESAGQPVPQPAAQPADRAAMLAQIASWHPAAVVAVTSEDSMLGNYLIGVLGPPGVNNGTILGWRLGPLLSDHREPAGCRLSSTKAERSGVARANTWRLGSFRRPAGAASVPRDKIHQGASRWYDF